MLARIAAALQNGELQGIEGITGQGFGGGGGTIVIDDNCLVSVSKPLSPFQEDHGCVSNSAAVVGDVSHHWDRRVVCL